MVRKKRCFITLMVTALACVGAVMPFGSAAVQAKSISQSDKAALHGYWLSQERDGVFRLEECGDKLCGRLVALQYEGTNVPRDKNGKSECNLLMLTDFKPTDGKRWSGKILDPDSGAVYQAQIWLSSHNVLKLRGYIGLPLFGETQVWSRYQTPGKIGPECKMLP
ncbi:MULTISPECIES: DUF2147 domain-containing protein [Acetobacter]|uniref:DUF2147 domain-containing protein n=1 Tax=Acetobacter TaxID=434 RepID=UPI001E4C7E3E|nr:DUF2147 domain-containing protein [Acetobacter sp. DsW_059]